MHDEGVRIANCDPGPAKNEHHHHPTQKTNIFFRSLYSFNRRKDYYFMRKNKAGEMERFCRMWTPTVVGSVNCGRMAVSQLAFTCSDKNTFLFNKKNPSPVPCKLWAQRQIWFYLTLFFLSFTDLKFYALNKEPNLHSSAVLYCEQVPVLIMANWSGLVDCIYPVHSFSYTRTFHLSVGS